MASQHPSTSRPLSIVTGASSGMGRELALLAAREGFDVMAAANTPLDEVTAELMALGAHVTSVIAKVLRRAASKDGGTRYRSSS